MTELATAIAHELSDVRNFADLGLEEGPSGDWRAVNPRLITFYSCFDEYEINIVLQDGTVFGLCVPRETVAEGFKHIGKV